MINVNLTFFAFNVKDYEIKFHIKSIFIKNIINYANTSISA
jgi:hypothetical protein